MTNEIRTFFNQYINQGKYFLLAETMHNSWVQQKISQGWSYGEQRDNIAKKNPLLIPFKQLPQEIRSANCLTPYAVANFFRQPETIQALPIKPTTIADMKILFEKLLSEQHPEILDELGEYIHSHFLIGLFAQGESTRTRQDMIIYENLEPEVQSWDTNLGLETIKNIIQDLP